MNKKNKKSLNFPLRLLTKTVLFSSILSLMLPATSFADWQIHPIVKVGGEVDDNADLDGRTDQEIDLSGFLAEASAEFAFSSERTSFSVVPRYLYRKYSDNPEFDFDDLYLSSKFNHQMQSSSIGFRVKFDQQQIRTAERADTDLETDEVDEVTADDSGRVGLTGDRTKWRFVPSWNYTLSNVSSITADVNYFNVTYDGVLSSLLTDYSDARLNFSYRRALSNRNTGIFTLTGRQYSANDPSVEDVSGFGFLAGVDREISEKTRIRAMIGFENTEQTAGQTDPELIGNLTLTRRLETITLFAQYRRSVNASGAGQASIRDQVNVNFKRRLSERITAGLGIRAYQTNRIRESVTIDEQNYVQLRTQFIWHLNPSFSVEADYRFTVLDRGVVLGERANSNRVNLWFVYQPNSQGR